MNILIQLLAPCLFWTALFSPWPFFSLFSLICKGFFLFVIFITNILAVVLLRIQIHLGSLPYGILKVLLS